MELLEDVLAFVRQYESSDPPEKGIEHFALRRLVAELGSVADLVQYLSEGDPDISKEEILDRIRRVHGFVVQLDASLTTPAATPEEVLLEAIQSRFNTRLDAILTASAVRLPSELHRQSIDARTIRTRHDAHRQVWTATRNSLLSQRHNLQGAVASLAYAYERRHPLEQYTNECDDLIGQTNGCIQTLCLAEQSCKDEVVALLALQERAQTEMEKARGIISALHALRASARTLDVVIPTVVSEQIRETQEALESVLDNMRDDFSDLPRVERDPAFQDAIEEIKVLSARKEQILHPIRPSVFKQPLDRPEELRRLALIALSFCTDRNDHVRKDQRHGGLGKHSVPEILAIADIIDDIEVNLCADAIFTMHKDNDFLVEQSKKGKFWRYRTTPAGNEQAGEWLDECLDKADLLARIDRARVERNTQLRQRHHNKAAA